ncbi:CHASE2 domain-containing protein [Coleofasciculus sp. LEGE 07081]|uniref:CHASE2 domain-containing protein n=1 Tax=Coleofasciculus sp. LEGE 07081 TaxID=2777967 RepID=UPI00187E380F|nr:CHASE2 domain-containing protein [Coleofasciculus sp. LEGE 07081]MBE9128196.1 CHASE2 domain-containing protein [Coleofasciculus sp. LEGE 07081]
MNRSPIFQLTVCRLNTQCSFTLTCWSENQQLQANLEYPRELERLYEAWQCLYPKAYLSLPRGRGEEGGGLTPSSLDPQNQLEEAKQSLLWTFNQWLGEHALLNIREKIQSEASRQTPENKGVDLLVACNSIDLVRLPWEAWDLNSEAIRISRTVINVENEPVSTQTNFRRGKARILVVLTDTSELSLNKDREAVRQSSKVAEVCRLKFKLGQNAKEFKQQFVTHLRDERGWDALIFAGHSDETPLTGGSFELAPGVTLSMSEVEEQFAQAKNQGLRVAIFNSCKGLRIAESLIKLGLSQVVVMREKIHDRVAPAFLDKFCQSLTRGKDVQEAVQDACNYFKSEKITYPSAYLIPSLFRRPFRAELFRIEPSPLKQAWRDWKPTRREAIALSSVLLFSLMLPVQDLLLDVRTLAQAFYRHQTKQLPREASPPVRLIAIDQESINEANETIKEFETFPMERAYLAQLVRRLSELNVRTIGIDYLLSTQEPRQKQLSEAIESAVKQQSIWFVFAIDNRQNKKVFSEIATPQWSLQGDLNFWRWYVELPTKATCSSSCPFAYLLALSHTLNQSLSLTGLPQPNLQNRTEFQQELSDYLNTEKGQKNAIASLKQTYSPFGWRSILDFSIPPEQVYERMSSGEFLKSAFPGSELHQQIRQQTVVIASGGYPEAGDNFSLPLAVQYWRRVQNSSQPKAEELPSVFTGGEAHAYMIHHLLSQHRVTLIPSFWMVLLVALLGKGMTLILLKQQIKQREQWKLGLVGATGAYGVVGFQAYLWSSVLIPWFLPSVMFWFYVLSVL